MTEPDYAAIRRKVEKSVSRQKWIYRITFFGMHLLFYAVAMLVVWGVVAAYPQLAEVLFMSESGAVTIVILPTILWGAVILFHAASLFFETGVGEKAIRDRILRHAIGEEILRKGLIDMESQEKPKRDATASESERMTVSDDGELIPIDEAAEERYNTRTNYAGNS